MQGIWRWIISGDHKAFALVNDTIKCRALDKCLPILTHLGGAFFTCIFPILLISFGNAQGKTIGIHIAFTLLFSHLIVRALKGNVKRVRPYDYLEEVNTLGLFWDDFSFPSGHTTAIFSISMTLALHMPDYIKVFICIAMLIGISRIYIGVHYPSDVVVGAAIGVLSAIFVNRYLMLIWISIFRFEMFWKQFYS